MRILIVFLDMVRSEMGYKSSLDFAKENPLAEIFKRIGGEYYTDCYTPSPDTTRSLASAFSGWPSHKNGCNTRIRFAKHYLKDDISDMFMELIGSGYNVNIFHEPEERELGIFPASVYKTCHIHKDYDLNAYLTKISNDRSDNRCDYIGISDFHQVYNDYGYDRRGARRALSQLARTVETLAARLDLDSYDNCFIFSDHGFMISEDLFHPAVYLGKERTNVVMLHRRSGDKELLLNRKFCSVMSLCASVGELVGSKVGYADYPLWASKEIDKIIVQDHFNYQPRVMHNIEYWGIISKDSIYSRTLEGAFTLVKESGNIVPGIDEDCDEILKKETMLGEYIRDFEALGRQLRFAEKEARHIIGRLAMGEVRRRSKLKKLKDLGKRLKRNKKNKPRFTFE